MTDRRALKGLLQDWAPIVAFALIGLIVGWWSSASAPVGYTATSVVLLTPRSTGTGAVQPMRVSPYHLLDQLPEVLQEAADRTGRSAAEIKGSVGTTALSGDLEVEISATSTRAQDAARISDAVATTLAAYTHAHPERAGAVVELLDRAEEPSTPDSRPATPYAGAFIGCVFGAAVTSVRRQPRNRTSPADGDGAAADRPRTPHRTD